MFDIYKSLFNLFFKEVRKCAETDVDNCVLMCDMWKTELYGMLLLLSYAGLITYDQHKAEQKRVSDAFDSIAVCDAYRIPGKVRRCSKKMKETLGKS